MGVADQTRGKIELDAYLSSGSYGSLEMCYYEKEGLSPFAVSSQMSPKVSYRNRPINNHMELNKIEKRLLLNEYQEDMYNESYQNKFFHSRFNFLDERFEYSNLIK